MGVWAVCMPVHQVCVWCPWRLEEDATGVMGGYKLLWGYWELNPDTLEELSVLLTAEPYFRPLLNSF